MIVDTHCHIHFDAFDADREDVIRRAREAGVKYLVNVGTDPETNSQAMALAKSHQDLFWSAGLHPHSSHEVSDAQLDGLEAFVRQNKPFAIGEIGLDYFKSEAGPEVQKKVFVRMLRLALSENLPVIVHSRNAFRDTADILKAEGGGKLKGVMHCFSYDMAAFEELLKLGFLASFTGNVTYRNAGAFAEVAKSAPLDKIMLETDSPYLSPQAHRGKRNEPAHLAQVAEFLASARGVAREELERVTTKTAVGFFRLPVSAS